MQATVQAEAEAKTQPEAETEVHLIGLPADLPPAQRQALGHKGAEGAVEEEELPTQPQALLLGRKSLLLAEEEVEEDAQGALDQEEGHPKAPQALSLGRLSPVAAAQPDPSNEISPCECASDLL
jgi:hypothetical protein